jgi:hypothetical protein
MKEFQMQIGLDHQFMESFFQIAKVVFNYNFGMT